MASEHAGSVAIFRVATASVGTVGTLFSYNSPSPRLALTDTSQNVQPNPVLLLSKTTRRRNQRGVFPRQRCHVQVKREALRSPCSPEVLSSLCFLVSGEQQYS
jgi:hypothetical protein